MDVTISANPADYPMHTHREFLAAVAAERERCEGELRKKCEFLAKQCEELCVKAVTAERERCICKIEQVSVVDGWGIAHAPVQDAIAAIREGE